MTLRTFTSVFVMSLAAGGCGGGFKHLPITPAAVKAGSGGARTFHFAYEGGCMDIDTPQGWDRIPAKSENITRFGNIANGHQTAAVDRFDVKKGTSLQNFAKTWAENRMKDINKKSETAKRAFGDDVNEKLVWKDEDLEMVTIGTEPNVHEAASYAMGYTTVKVKSDDNFAKRFNRSQGLADTVTTTVTLGAAAIHQHFFISDGPAYLSIVFNARAEDWKEFAPAMGQMVASMRFGACN